MIRCDIFREYVEAMMLHRSVADDPIYQLMFFHLDEALGRVNIPEDEILDTLFFLISRTDNPETARSMEVLYRLLPDDPERAVVATRVLHALAYNLNRSQVDEVFTWIREAAQAFAGNEEATRGLFKLLEGTRGSIPWDGFNAAGTYFHLKFARELGFDRVRAFEAKIGGVGGQGRGVDITLNRRRPTTAMPPWDKAKYFELKSGPTGISSSQATSFFNTLGGNADELRFVVNGDRVDMTEQTTRLWEVMRSRSGIGDEAHESVMRRLLGDQFDPNVDYSGMSMGDAGLTVDRIRDAFIIPFS